MICPACKITMQPYQMLDENRNVLDCVRCGLCVAILPDSRAKFLLDIVKAVRFMESNNNVDNLYTVVSELHNDVYRYLRRLEELKYGKLPMPEAKTGDSKISCIKRYREQFGVSLRLAKQKVDALWDVLKSQGALARNGVVK